MSKTICNYPFRHLYIDTNSHHKICCMPDEYIEKPDRYRHFNMKDGLLKPWNSEYMKDIRLKMMNGQKHSACSKCYMLEESGVKSLRTLAGLNDIEKYKKSLNPDGSMKTLPETIELHFGNVCNLKCRMCSHFFSHMLGKELLEIKDKDIHMFKWIQNQGGNVNNWSTGNLSEVYDWFKDKTVLKNTFEEISDHVKKIHAIGGEPTIIPEFWQLFQFLSEKNTIGQKELMLTTNGTNTNKNIVNYFSKLKSVGVMVSIDGLDQRNRYIRYPSDWSTIIKNLEVYKEIKIKSGSAMNYWVGLTPQILNIDHITDTIIFFESRGHSCSLNPIVVSPKILNYIFFPLSYKQLVKKKLLKNYEKIKSNKSRKDVQQIIESLDADVDKKEIKENITNFIKYMDYIDKLRKEDSWRSLMPELEKNLINF